MAYNPYSVGYQPMYYSQNVAQQPVQPMSPTPMSGTSQNSSIIWVQGEAGAKSYLVAPNTTVQLWDSEANVIYLKSADASGMPSMKVIDYTIRGAEIPNNGFSFDEHKFISRDEFDGLKNEFDALKSELSNLKPNRKENRQNG